MNKTHRLIWNTARNAWIVTHEAAATRGKPSTPKRRLASALAGALLAQTAFAAAPLPNALPTGGQVVAGQAAISQAGNAMTINQGSDKAILNWQSFNIGSQASVTFQQPSSSSVALNRVLGADPSAIYGHLNANGQVFLINPSGVLFGQGARVDVGGMVASTLNITNADFLNGNYRFSGNGGEGGVVNAGELYGRYIALLAPEVRNEGIVAARLGTSALAAGGAVTLDIAGGQLLKVKVDKASFDTLVENKHLIQAEGGTVILSAQSANDLLGRAVNSGAIDASGISTDGGTVRLTASSSVEHSGSITADAGQTGKGGSAVLLANLDNPNSRTSISGAISAKGGSASGNGGFIETSGHRVSIADTASFNTSAPYGRTGMWLLDPVSFTVAATNGDMTGTALSNQLNGVGQTATDVTLRAQCATANACNPTPSVVDGDIFINDSVSWGTAKNLTLDAGRNINVNAPITVSGSGSLMLKFGQAGSSSDVLPPAGNYFVRAPINLAASSSFQTQYMSDGTPINYTIVRDGTGLAAINTSATTLAGNYVLGADISLSGNQTPIGDDTTAFEGIFDGLGHKITGLSIPGTGANNSNVGLFGVLRTHVDPVTFATIGPGIVQNVGLVDANVAGLSNVGALVGKNEGAISNSYATSTGVNTSVVTGRDLGGIGANPGTTDDVVTAIGGLVGYNTGSISGSYANVTVTATSGDQLGTYGTPPMGTTPFGGIGGFVGVHTTGSLTNNYAAGNVTGINNVGGFVGFGASSIAGNFSRGQVNGTGTGVGGFIGYFDNPMSFPGLLSANFWDKTTSLQTSSGGQAVDQVTGMTTAQMLVANNFKQATADNGASTAPGWQNSGGWELRDGSYPLLTDLLRPIFVYANSTTATYSGTAVSGFSTTISGGTAGDYTGTASVTPSTASPTNVGSYTLTPGGLTLTASSDQNGYRLQFVDGTLTINKAHLTVTADNQTRLYGQANPTFSETITGYVNGENATSAGVTGSATGSSTATATTGVGSYTITGSTGTLAAANYDFTAANGSLTINRAHLTVTADNQTRLYGQANPTFTETITGYVNGENATSAGVTGTATGSSTATTTTGVGGYAITGNTGTLAAANYDFTAADGTLTINKAHLTVTADNQARLYGQANPTFTETITGYVNGENATSAGVTGSATGSSTATTTTGIGSYTITGGTGNLAAANYDFTAANGTLTINRAHLTVTADNQTRLTDQPNPTFTETITGYVNGENATSAGVTGTATGSSTATTSSSAGNYTITGSTGSLAAANYDFTAANGTLTITSPSNPQLEKAVETIYKALDNIGITKGLGLDTTKTSAGPSSGVDAKALVKELQQAASTGSADDSTKTRLQQLVQNACGTCTVSTSDIDAFLLSSHKDFLAKAATDTQNAATSAATNTQAKINAAADAAVKAKLATDAAAADPTSSEKAAAAKAAAKLAADAKAAADQAAADQTAADKKAAETKAAADADSLKPKDRSAEINRIADAAKTVLKNTMLAWGMMFGDPKSKEYQEAKKQMDSEETVKQAQSVLDTLDPDTKTKMLKLLDDQDKAATAAVEKQKADKALADAQAAAKAAAEKAAASAAAAKAADDAANADPTSTSKALAAMNAHLQASKDKLAARDAETAALDAGTNAANKADAADDAQAKVTVSKAQVTAYLSGLDKQAADNAANQKAKTAVATAVSAGLTAFFAQGATTVADANKAAADKAKSDSAAATSDMVAANKALADKQAAANKVAADANTAAGNAAAQQATADSATATTKAAADSAAETAKDAAQKTAVAQANLQAVLDAPKKAAIIAELNSLEPLLRNLAAGQMDAHISGTQVNAEQAAYSTLQSALANASSTDLATLQKALDSVKANARAALATHQEQVAYNAQDLRQNKFYLDQSNALELGLKQQTLDQIGTSAAAKVATSNAAALEDVLNKAKADQAAADSAATTARIAAENAAAESKEAADKAAAAKTAAATALAAANAVGASSAEKLAAEAAAKKATDAAAAADAAAKKAADQDAAAKQFADAATSAKAAADKAAADSAAANAEAKQAAADSAAANLVVIKEQAALAANAKANADRELAAAKDTAAQKAALSNEAASDAAAAKATAAQAQVDKAKWEKVAADKTAEITSSAQVAAADLATAKDLMKNVTASGLAADAALAEANEAIKAEGDANSELFKATQEYLDAAKSVGDTNPLAMLGNVLEGKDPIGVMKFNEAKEAYNKAKADYDAAKQAADEKKAAFDVANTKANADVDAYNAAAAKANKSATAAEQAKLDKAAADQNVVAFTQYASDTAAYANAVESDAARAKADAAAASDAIGVATKRANDAAAAANAAAAAVTAAGG